MTFWGKGAPMFHVQNGECAQLLFKPQKVIFQYLGSVRVDRMCYSCYQRWWKTFQILLLAFTYHAVACQTGPMQGRLLHFPSIDPCFRIVTWNLGWFSKSVLLVRISALVPTEFDVGWAWLRFRILRTWGVAWVWDWMRIKREREKSLKNDPKRAFI